MTEWTAEQAAEGEEIRVLDGGGGGRGRAGGRIMSLAELRFGGIWEGAERDE